MADLPTQYEGIMPLRPAQQPPFMHEDMSAPYVEGETRPWRHFKARDGLLQQPSPDVRTVYDIFTGSAKRFGDKPAIGTRRLVHTHVERKQVPKIGPDGQKTLVDKEWTYFELSPYSFMTYRDYEARAFAVGAGLRKLGVASGDVVHIFATTSANWQSMAHGCSSQSITIATAYDTLGPDAVEYSLVQTAAKAMYTDPHLLKTAERPLNNAPDAKILIYNDDSNFPVSDDELAAFRANNQHLTVLSINELVALGRENHYPPQPPQPEDLCCIMYTSGSSGTPKGVPITHQALIAAITGLYSVIEETISHREIVLAYLPLAHILEMAVENLVMCWGGTVGYGSPRTMSDTNMRNCAGDMRELAPTVMVGVPQVWETIRKGVEARVNGGGALTRNLFWGAYALKSWMVSAGLPGTGLLDAIVFNKVRTMAGGRLRFLFNGGSGISASTLYFTSLVFAPMVTGYGLTETCAVGALGCPLHWAPDAIGPCPPSLEIKLVALPDLDYRTDTKPPRGEILLRGATIGTGYYKNPEETAKAYTADGWFRTGDIGEIDERGFVSVIDRIKNLVKLQGGEYVALEKLEAVYRGSAYVANLMVHADSTLARPVAVVAPNEKALAELADGLGVDHAAMHTDSAVREAVFRDLLAVGKRQGLGSLETICGLAIVEDEWTPATGLVTATQKVNRRAIKEKYNKLIAGLGKQ